MVLNQVLVGFGDDERTDRVIAAIQRDGTCWMGGTTWHGRRLMRIAVSNWSTTEDDVDRSVEAILRIAAGGVRAMARYVIDAPTLLHLLTTTSSDRPRPPAGGAQHHPLGGVAAVAGSTSAAAMRTDQEATARSPPAHRAARCGCSATGCREGRRGTSPASATGTTLRDAEYLAVTQAPGRRAGHGRLCAGGPGRGHRPGLARGSTRSAQIGRADWAGLRAQVAAQPPQPPRLRGSSAQRHTMWSPEPPLRMTSRRRSKSSPRRAVRLEAGARLTGLDTLGTRLARPPSRIR